jgi:hypothetical protein
MENTERSAQIRINRRGLHITHLRDLQTCSKNKCPFAGNIIDTFTVCQYYVVTELLDGLAM